MGNDTSGNDDMVYPKGEAKPSIFPRILVVDDDPSLRSMYSQKFELDGFVVMTASSGKEALEIALNEKVDAMLLDMLLPEMPGNEVLKKLREDERGKNIVVVALSNLVDLHVRDEAMKNGASEYLEKALYTPEKVVEVVKKHLKI